MRNRERLIHEGRNDPNSAQQQREHPYDFVQLSDRVERLPLAWLQRQTISATGVWLDIELKLTAVQPIANGCGIIGKAGNSVGRLPARDSAGHLIVTGSSIKGALRSNYEAITHSCVWNGRTSFNEDAGKLPDVLRGRGFERRTNVAIVNPPPSLRSPCRPRGHQLDLCPACGLFGALGYKGRIGFEDAIAEPAEGQVVHAIYRDIPAQSSGQAHRIGIAERRESGIAITELWGRRVALRPSRPRTAVDEEDRERVVAVRAGGTLRTHITLVDVQPCEVGMLFLAMGWGQNAGLLRLGGFKAVGFGLVSVEILGIRGRGVDAQDAEAAAVLANGHIEQARAWKAFWPTGLEELEAILTRPLGGTK